MQKKIQKRAFRFLLATVLLTPGATVAEELSVLKSYWHDHRIDYFGTAMEMGQHAALNVFGYEFVRNEALLYPSPTDETVSLELFWSEDLQDNATVAAEASKQDVLAAGYELKATEGYIYASKQTGTVPLNLYYSERLKDYYTTTPGDGENAATSEGYLFVRVEGYVFPPIAEE